MTATWARLPEPRLSRLVVRPLIADGVIYPTASIGWRSTRHSFHGDWPRPSSLPRVIRRALDRLTAQLAGRTNVTRVHNSRHMIW